MLRDAYSTFVDKGVAILSPDFGSVFKHSGPDALDLLHRITTNSLIDLSDGTARRTVLTTDKGRVIDAPWVIKIAHDELLLLSDAPSAVPMREGILRYTIIEDAELTDVTDETARIMVFGEKATEAILAVFPDTQAKPNGSEPSVLMHLDGDTSITALQTDAAGVATWVIVAGSEQSEEILGRFESLGLCPSHRSIFDFVRIKNGCPIAGQELTEDVNPLESSLHELIDFDKGCYVGQEVIARLDTYDKVQRRLVAFDQVGANCDLGGIEPGERIIPPHGGREIGWISSTAVDPDTDASFGLAYVRGAFAESVDTHETSGGHLIVISPNRS